MSTVREKKAKRQAGKPGAKRVRPAARYSWKPGSRFRVKASVAGAALDALRARTGGGLTPAAVVEAASSPRHPLHPCFVWDDTEAARKWRDLQARNLINSVRVVVAGGEAAGPRVAYVSVAVREGGRNYLPAAAVMGDDEYRAASLAEAVAALRGWRVRYGHLRELADVFAAADRVVRKAA